MLEARVNDDDKTTIMNIVKNNLEEIKKKFDGKGFSVAIHADLSFGNKLHITVIREEELQKWTSQRILHLSSSVNREKNIKFQITGLMCTSKKNGRNLSLLLESDRLEQERTRWMGRLNGFKTTHNVMHLTIGFIYSNDPFLKTR